MSIEAMKQALEALETLARYENPETRVQVRKPRDGGPIVTMYPHKVATDAADALRTAIAEAEKRVPVAYVGGGTTFQDLEWADNPPQLKNGTPLYTTPPAAPAQEPVAQDVQEKCRIETVPAKGGLLPDPTAAQQEPVASAGGPEELWLQLHGDSFGNELAEPVDYTDDSVTWCWHQIHRSDVRYVRADLATPPAAQPAAPEDWRDLVLMALPNYVPQEDWLLSPCAPLMSEDSHEMMHWDTIEKIVKAVATPPAAQRQPLTDEQIHNLDPIPHHMFDAERIDFARAIEAAHGITGEQK